MVPDIKLRLQSVLSSLEQCISHSIPAGDKVAHEQLALIKGTLSLVLNQFDYEQDLLVKDTKQHLALVEQLLQILPGEDTRIPELKRLASMIDEQLPVKVTNRRALEELHLTVIRSLESVTNDLASDYSSDALPALYKAVIEHSQKQAFLYRAWMAGCGFDLDKKSLPELEQLFQDT